MKRLREHLDDDPRDLETLRAENRLLREAIEHSPLHFGIYDRDARLVHWNREFEEAFPETFAARAEDAAAGRLTYADLMREAVAATFPPEEAAAELERRIEANRSVVRASHMTWNRAKGHMKVLRYRVPSGGVAAMAVDMNDAVRASRALEQARAAADAHRRRLQEALDALPFAIGLHDPQGRIVMINRIFRDAANLPDRFVAPGASYEEMIRQLVRQRFYDVPGDALEEERLVRERMTKLLSAGPPYESVLSDGRVFNAYDTRTASGDIISCRVDITELKRVQRRLEEQASALAEAKEASERQAMQDALTGLPNRRRLDEALARVQEEAQAQGELVALLHVDLDRFKQINDTLGHAAGDHVLREAACILTEELGARGIAARVGGDEFVIVLRRQKRLEEAMRLADRLVARLQEPLDFNGVPCRVGASIGVAFMRGGEIDPGQLMINADLAMYRAKEEGRNRVVAYTRRLQAEVVRIKTLADEIVAGLEREEFFAIYQPQFRAADLELRGVEALCRWRHPKRGVLPPSEFLHVAEDMQVVDRIDRLVFQSAVRDMRGFLAAGLAPFRIAFNMSVGRLLEPELREQIRALQALGVEVAAELLESISFDELNDELRFALDGLREQGVRIEIDDFGSARASVLGLTAVMPDAMKLDRQIVIPATRSAQSLQLLEAMLQIGRALEIEVIAEGVETEEHVALLRRLGVDALQGFALSHALPARELAALLSSSAEARRARPDSG